MVLEYQMPFSNKQNAFFYYAMHIFLKGKELVEVHLLLHQ